MPLPRALARRAWLEWLTRDGPPFWETERGALRWPSYSAPPRAGPESAPRVWSAHADWSAWKYGRRGEFPVRRARASSCGKPGPRESRQVARRRTVLRVALLRPHTRPASWLARKSSPARPRHARRLASQRQSPTGTVLR